MNIYKMLALAVVVTVSITAQAGELFSCKTKSTTGTPIEVSIASELEVVTENPDFGVNKLSGSAIINGQEMKFVEQTGGAPGGVYGPMNLDNPSPDIFPKTLVYKIETAEIGFLIEAFTEFDENKGVSKKYLVFLGERATCEN